MQRTRAGSTHPSAVSPNPWHKITLAECFGGSSGESIIVPPLLRRLERARTVNGRCLSGEKERPTKSRFGRMIWFASLADGEMGRVRRGSLMSGHNDCLSTWYYRFFLVQ